MNCNQLKLNAFFSIFVLFFLVSSSLHSLESRAYFSSDEDNQNAFNVNNCSTISSSTMPGYQEYSKDLTSYMNGSFIEKIETAWDNGKSVTIHIDVWLEVWKSANAIAESDGYLVVKNGNNTLYTKSFQLNTSPTISGFGTSSVKAASLNVSPLPQGNKSRHYDIDIEITEDTVDLSQPFYIEYESTVYLTCFGEGYGTYARSEIDSAPAPSFRW